MTTATRHDDIRLALVGCDFRVASAAWRGALVLSPEERADLAERLRSAADMSGFAVLDTCNRTEWIVESPHPAWAADLLRAWMMKRFGERGEEPPTPYVHVGAPAVRHYLRVAVGLESFAAGEREIAGQCSRALLVARTQGLASPLLDELSKCAGRTVRRVERLGHFRDATRGVHAIATELVLGRLDAASIRQPVIGIVGLGVLGRKLAATLESPRVKLVVFNRSPRSGSPARPLGELDAALAGLDALIVATGARRACVHVGGMAARARPLLVVDLGLPAQVSVDRDADVELLGLDDLAPHEDSGARRDAELAAQLAEAGVNEFLLACARRAALDVVRTASRMRDSVRDVRLPQILEEHLADLAPTRRRRLEGALRALLTEQHRVLLGAIERAAPAPREPAAAARSETP